MYIDDTVYMVQHIGAVIFKDSNILDLDTVQN